MPQPGFAAVGLKNQVFDPHPNIFQDMKYGSTGCGCVGVYIYIYLSIYLSIYLCVCVCIQLQTGSTPFISPKFDFCRSKCYNPSFTPQTVEKLDPPKPVHGPRQQPSATKTTEDPLQFGLSGLVLPHVAPGCGCGWVIPSICSANPEPEQLRQRHHDAWPAWH